ncbi:MAG: hypothetical protein WC931_03675 [Bacilli bacterium]
MKRKIVIAAACFLLMAVGVAAGYLVLSGKRGEPLSSTVRRGDKQAEDHEALLSELTKKRGGLPIDQALRQASTPEAKEFIQKDMAYQRQTREQAAEEARRRLIEVKDRMNKSVGKEESKTLEKQVMMLEQLVEKLEGR